MDFDDSPEEAAFRLEARRWLRAQAKEKEQGQLSTSHSFYDFDEVFVTEGKAWQRRLYDGGWAGITWPVRFGGRGGDVVQAMIFRQEEANFDVTSGLFAVAIGMAGPTIIGHGTDEQRARYLPPMLRGEEVWCQLFSEPGAGSDLASLATRADPDGDQWVVNGQKVWSSGAHHADKGILLARTSQDLPKHRGITFFIVDMHTEGIDARPLRQMTGGATFNEVFFTDVRIPAANVVGEVNGGWRATMTTLSNERGLRGGTSDFEQVLKLAREGGASGHPAIRQRLARCFVEEQIIKYLGFRVQTALAKGLSSAETSLIKLVYSQMARETTELALAIEGPGGMLTGGDAPEDGYWQRQFLSAPSLRIAAGSDEVQRNVIGERVLGLPHDVQVDRDIPFRDTIR
ncbi:MAG TPA: acyl-CoA dehydrogenase family protein [Acidimicrobiales bacterium]|jgi:alkylation response protein AidB-like acyl-CoA dehydrogenase|nr:acyl-CoA dehydrogenase family protein [Acidimicrobiales bacterium]